MKEVRKWWIVRKFKNKEVTSELHEIKPCWKDVDLGNERIKVVEASALQECQENLRIVTEGRDAWKQTAELFQEQLAASESLILKMAEALEFYAARSEHRPMGGDTAKEMLAKYRARKKLYDTK